MTIRRLILPPARRPRRLLSSDTFDRRFEPLPAPTHDLLWQTWELPQRVQPREWWTVIDCEGRLIVSAGVRFVNRFGYIRCRHLWDGEPDQHPDYRV